jgi:hypothetical protein
VSVERPAKSGSDELLQGPPSTSNSESWEHHPDTLQDNLQIELQPPEIRPLDASLEVNEMNSELELNYQSDGHTSYMESEAREINQTSSAVDSYQSALHGLIALGANSNVDQQSSSERNALLEYAHVREQSIASTMQHSATPGSHDAGETIPSVGSLGLSRQSTATSPLSTISSERKLDILRHFRYEVASWVCISYF